ncbi:ribosomal protein S6 kinase delta-1 isoform X2 [Nymphalis io]|uniref:ribosomal protein S6 kinase delta-1 isoform X2 n=1 Tax=Inachis io TaxID=171585 RepID=UPI0021680B03|nr:ribosomal protein S6 kinase delta-1 isoform X2 [Nymphalis io]
MSARDKWVRRFSIDETAKHKNGFTIYKITSVLFPIDSPEAVTVISVWKRYSDIQQLHKSMKSLHSGLHLKGTFPQLAKSSFFKRFHPEVIDERAKTIKALLEFVAEHRLLFTSTDFVNFLQTGYPEPDPKPSGVINAIRSSLHLPIEENPPLEYQTSDDEARSPTAQNQNPDNADPGIPTDIEISQIPIYEAADVEIRESPETSPKASDSDSFESINSLDGIDGSPLEEASDLVSGGGASTSRASAPSRSVARRASGTQAALQRAARCERRGAFAAAFAAYRAAVGAQLRAAAAETDPQIRAQMKEEINKYLTHAEALYKNHLSNDDLNAPPAPPRGPHAALPLRVLRACRSELGAYRVLARRARVLLVLHRQQQHCRAMKVIQKIPKNLTDFDDYFHQRSNETRQPILPTLIPYMVPLHAYVETEDLIFLILSYAPGERLFDYIKNYKHSSPNTREVNLEHVFNEQRKRTADIDVQNDNINKIDVCDDVNENLEGTDVLDNVDMSVNELVKNSQKLLLNVDRVLTEVPNMSSVRKEDKVEVEEEKGGKIERETERIEIDSNLPQPKSEIPPSAVCRWGAEILTALESLHNCGVIWRDLRPRNVLLGARGHVLLSYCVAYADSDVTLANLARSGEKDCLFVAPELLQLGHDPTDVACDFWSFGVIMYELLCGYPPAARRPPAPPRALPTDARALLSQLLTLNPAERLGSGKDGIEEIKQHPYFRHIDWQEVYDSWIVPD